MPSRAEELAQQFHETYERLAPEHGYETRPESRKPWESVPENNRQLMIAVCQAVIDARVRPLVEALEAAMEYVQPNCTIATDRLKQQARAALNAWR